MAKIILKCDQCGTEFTRIKSVHERRKNTGRSHSFCNFECSVNYKRENSNLVKTNCGYCGREVARAQTEFNKSKSGHAFCNSSCSASYNNKNKKTGHRRSRLERSLEKHIIETYPDLLVLCNDKSAIGSELDFYFPDLKLAIELNGIFHYEPIYGEDKLTRIKDNDKQKMAACKELGIELAVVCTHDGLRISEKRTKMYMGVIDKIIVLSKREQPQDRATHTQI